MQPQEETALHTLLKDPSAAEESILEKIRKHVEAGICVNAIDETKRTPLYNAIISRKSLKVIEYLLYLEANVNGYADRKPILAALKNGDLSMVEYLTKHGAALEVYDGQGNSVLHVVLNKVKDAQTCYTTVEFLLNAGIDANRGDLSGSTPLHLAIRRQHLGLVKLLIERGAALDAKDYEDRSLLYSAVFHDFYDAAKLLIELGADTNDRDYRDVRMLSTAISNLNKRMVALLLENKAIVQSEEDLVKAAECGSLDMIKLLVSRGASATAKSSTGYKMFYGAMLSGMDVHLISYVVKHAIDFSAKHDPVGSFGVSPLIYMIRKVRSYGVNYFGNPGVRARKDRLFNERVLKILLKQIHLNLALGLPVHPRHKLFLQDREVATFSTFCKEELERMKVTGICNHGSHGFTTYFEILARSGDDLARRLCRKEIYDELETDEYEQLFPIYVDELEDKFLPVFRKFRVDEFCEIFYRILNGSLPLDVIYKVSDSFDNAELKDCVRALELV